MKLPNFIGPSNRSLSPIADIERTMNMYLEARQSPGQISDVVLYSIYGFETLVDTGISGVGRAAYVAGTRYFCIVGTSLMEVDKYGVITTRGTVAIDTNPATIRYNGDAGNQLLITSGGKAYCYDLIANTLTEIIILNPFTSVQITATMGEYLGGYGILLDGTKSIAFTSALNDFSTWDNTDFIQRSQASDPWVSMGVNTQYLHFIGTQTGEAWQQATSGNDAFTPSDGGLYNYGTEAPFSVHRCGPALCWFGSTDEGPGVTLEATGLRPKEISTNAFQYATNTYSKVNDAIGDAHEIAGHPFYTVTFPSAQATWAYDQSTPNWCERGYWNPVTFEYEAWRPIYHAHVFGQDRFLDLRSSKIYVMKSDLATEVDGNGIRWERTPSAVSKDNKLLFFGALEVICETGIGLTTGQGEDPQMMMRKSQDGGRTWSNEVWRTMGKVGEYGVRVRWNRNGRGRKTVFQVAGSDPVRVMLAGATVDVEESDE